MSSVYGIFAQHTRDNAEPPGNAGVDRVKSPTLQISFDLRLQMALIVQKYGGTSMGSPDRIRNVARRVARWKALGHQIVVVVSAMSGETNRLLALAKDIS